jgi:uncharacterized membrane protein
MYATNMGYFFNLKKIFTKVNNYPMGENSPNLVTLALALALALVRGTEMLKRAKMSFDSHNARYVCFRINLIIVLLRQYICIQFLS